MEKAGLLAQAPHFCSLQVLGDCRSSQVTVQVGATVNGPYSWVGGSASADAVNMQMDNTWGKKHYLAADMSYTVR